VAEPDLTLAIPEDYEDDLSKLDNLMNFETLIVSDGCKKRWTNTNEKVWTRIKGTNANIGLPLLNYIMVFSCF
jgi:hypothetical protein